jgi:hypothetical protein
MYKFHTSDASHQWRTQEFFYGRGEGVTPEIFFGGGGGSTFSWGQREERTGIWGR